MKSFRPVAGMNSASRNALQFVPFSAIQLPRTARALLLGVCAVLAGQAAVSAAEFYVSPSGTSSGTGSISSPWNLQTALNQPSVVKPGDTLWLRGGRYTGLFNSRLNGSSTAPIKLRQYPGERATLDTTGIQGSALTVSGSHTWYWGFEIASSSTKRVSAQRGSWPTDLNHAPAVATPVSGTGNKFINLIVHDNPLGLGLWSGNTDCEAYGNVIYYNGWNAPDRGHGHGIYTQNSTGYKRLIDNIIFHNADHGVQAYGSSSAGVNNYNLGGNIIFENSRLFTTYTSGRNLLVGGDAVAQNPLLRSNMVYRSSTTTGGTSDFYLGYTGGTANGQLIGNYIVGNSLFASYQSGLSLQNNYICGNVTGLNTANYPNNTFTTTRPTTGTKILVRANSYEPGRGNIAIYNWAKQSTVSVDVSNLGLQVGDTYELRNAMNYFGDIITGTYSGTPISVPMTGRTVAAPSGLPAPASPFPTFGAFVLLKKGGTTNPGNTVPTITTIPNQSILVGNSTGPLTFTIGDKETSAGNLTLKANPWVPSLIPANNIVFGGSGSNRTVTVTPAAGQTGMSQIDITVSDGNLETLTSFVVTVNASNTAPTLTSISSQSVTAGSSTGPLAFTVGDKETSAGSLTLTGSSSNTSLVPSGNIVFGGSGSNRTVTVTPVSGQTGSAVVTVRVSDGTANASTSFTLSVTAVVVNTAPTISGISAQSVVQGVSTGPIPFTVGDAETAAGSLTLSAFSSNTTLVPTANIVFGGSGASRTISVTPAAGATGTGTILVRVSDGILGTSASFSLTVTASTGGDGGGDGDGSGPGNGPTITAIADQAIEAGGTTTPLAFTIGSTTTSAGSLTVSAVCSDTTLVRNSDIIISGTGANRTVTVQPLGAEYGATSIMLTVSDGTLRTSTSFGLAISPSESTVYIPIEAESGTLVSPMVVSSNTLASGKAVVSSPSANAGSVEFDINIPVDGTYVLWCRVLAPNSSSDSFTVSVDGAGADVYDTAENIWSTRFQWTPVNGRNGGAPLTLNPRTLTLSAGPHRIKFQARDADAILDRLILTNDRQIAVMDDTP